MRRILMAVAVIIALPAPSVAQQSLCWASGNSDGISRTCNAIAHAAHVVQPAVGIAFSGGNPVPGASSTLGMRIGSIPRITLGGRIGGSILDMPNIKTEGSTGSDKTFARTLNMDAAVGLFSGWTIAPTIGGFGSLDLVASLGKISLPDEFTVTPGSWAVGARLGILRESFTAPGVSVTGMYRRIGDIRYGQASSGSASPPTFLLEDNSALSVRAIAGKRLFVLGANIGLGYDKYSSQPSVAVGGIGFGNIPELEQDRFTAFGNLSWTMLVLNAVLEAGYQRGGDEYVFPLPSGHTSKTQNSTYYGSLAIRLAL